MTIVTEVVDLDDITYEAPGSLDDLLDILEKMKVTILAGATDIMPKINDGMLKPTHLVYIGNVGLEGIRRESGQIIIGAATKLSDILENSLVKEFVPVLVQALANMAGVSIRNIGTIGGNLCNASPAADTAVPLLVMDAKLIALSKQGRRIIPIEAFFTGPGKTALACNEILAEIRIEIKPHQCAFIKIGQRKAETLSVISAASRIVLENNRCVQARLAMGSVAPRPVRCYKAEEILVGKIITAEMCERAAAIADEYATPIDDGRATAWYRKRVAPVLVERVLKRALGLKESEDREILN